MQWDTTTADAINMDLQHRIERKPRRRLLEIRGQLGGTRPRDRCTCLHAIPYRETQPLRTSLTSTKGSAVLYISLSSMLMPRGRSPQAVSWVCVAMVCPFTIEVRLCVPPSSHFLDVNSVEWGCFGRIFFRLGGSSSNSSQSRRAT